MKKCLKNHDFRGFEVEYGVCFWCELGGQGTNLKMWTYSSWCLKDWLFFNFLGVEETASIDKWDQGVFKSLIRLRNGIFRRSVKCKRKYRLLFLQLGMNNHESYRLCIWTYFFLPSNLHIAGCKSPHPSFLNRDLLNLPLRRRGLRGFAFTILKQGCDYLKLANIYMRWQGVWAVILCGREGER